MTAPLTRYQTPVPLLPEDCPILGTSEAIRRAIGLALRFAPTELPILLVGPTGSGKELFARCIHQWSVRRGPLVDVNAGALPKEMIESLLFGHRRGAFTGAVQSTEGLVHAAERGTLFLDELASLPLEGQAKLLRVLESGEVRSLGDTVNRPVRCRFVAAMQEDVDLRVRRGEFRLDLYQRLAGVVIRLPALAERPEDILPLARAFARTQSCGLTPPAEVVLGRHSWPGNVRELRATIVRASFLAAEGEIGTEAILEAIELSAPRGWATTETPLVLVSADREALVAHCRRHGWDIRAAARAVGIGRSTMYRRLREVGIDPLRWRTQGGEG